MASYYPPTNYFQNINFNNDFYAAPNNNQGVKLEYANTHYLYSTGVATSTAFTTFFSGSILQITIIFIVFGKFIKLIFILF